MRVFLIRKCFIRKQVRLDRRLIYGSSKRQGCRRKFLSERAGNAGQAPIGCENGGPGVMSKTFNKGGSS